MQERERLNDHPHEWQVWLFKSRWRPITWGNIWRWAKRHLLGFLIQGEELWSTTTGNHMAWRHGDEVVEADLPTVRSRFATEVARRNATIHVFAFKPPLSRFERADLAVWITRQIGKPYDLPLIATRGKAAAERLIQWAQTGVQPPRRQARDILKGFAYICYELIARGINHIRRGLVPVASFGPRDLWRLAERGRLVYRGTLQAE